MSRRFYVSPMYIKTSAFLADHGWLSNEEFGAYCRSIFSDWIAEHGRWRGRDSILPQLKREVFERDGAICSYCLTFDGPFEVDHIDPVNRGGADEIDNLCVSCRPCNRRKSDKTLLGFLST